MCVLPPSSTPSNISSAHPASAPFGKRLSGRCGSGAGYGRAVLAYMERRFPFDSAVAAEKSKRAKAIRIACLPGGLRLGEKPGFRLRVPGRILVMSPLLMFKEYTLILEKALSSGRAITPSSTAMTDAFRAWRGAPLPTARKEGTGFDDGYERHRLPGSRTGRDAARPDCPFKIPDFSDVSDLPHGAQLDILSLMSLTGAIRTGRTHRL